MRTAFAVGDSRGSDQFKRLELALQSAMQRRITITDELNGERRPAANAGATLLTTRCSPLRSRIRATDH
jgi:hypothetical protein